MGVPLLVALLGDAAAGPVIGAIVVDLVVTSTLCLALAQAHSQRARARRRRALDADRARRCSLRGALTNPLPWAIALGAAFAATRPRAAGAARRRSCACSATRRRRWRCSRSARVLWRAGQHAHTRTPVAHYLPVALIKLLVHPALVLRRSAWRRAALGAPVSPFGLMVLTLTAALPSASNVSLLAERYGADNGRIARIIMASTVLAFVDLLGRGLAVRRRASRARQQRASDGILYTESQSTPP